MDVRLGTFPFGGALSTIDCLRQAIPMVGLVGDQPHGRLEIMLMRLVGLPEWLMAKNESEYEAAALRLIHDDVERVKIARHLINAQVDRILFEEQPRRFPNDFVDTVSWLYDNHEAVQRERRKVWTYEDRQAFATAPKK
jgi:predicted O-linked N-acetylglucosamine transferase (SPINDLY family)